jgi:hypothetical protein
MPVVLLIAAVVILAGVVVVAVGRGGELAMARPDVPPVRFALFTPADVAAFRPRLAFFGYSARATDDALVQIARAVAERDAELSRLRVQLTALRDQMEDAGYEPDDRWPPAADREPDDSRLSAADRDPDDREPDNRWPPAADDDPVTAPQPAVAWPAAAADESGPGVPLVPEQAATAAEAAAPDAAGPDNSESDTAEPDNAASDTAGSDTAESAAPAAGHRDDLR